MIFRKTTILLLSAFTSTSVMVALSCHKDSEQPQVRETVQSPTPNQVILPAKHISSEIVQPGGTYRPDGGPLIGSLSLGQSGWIAPWSMWYTVEGNCYINPSHSYKSTQQPNWIKITRNTSSFDVQLHQTTFEWSPINIRGFPKEGDNINGVPVSSVKVTE